METQEINFTHTIPAETDAVCPPESDVISEPTQRVVSAAIALHETVAVTYDATGHDVMYRRSSSLPDEWHNRPA